MELLKASEVEQGPLQDTSWTTLPLIYRNMPLAEISAILIAEYETDSTERPLFSADTTCCTSTSRLNPRADYAPEVLNLQSI